MANTHYAIIVFAGDVFGEHPQESLRGTPPALEWIAAGDEDFCWTAIENWTRVHPLRHGEIAEVVARAANAVDRDPWGSWQRTPTEG